jgi:DNA replication protein DnaC
MAVAHQLAPQLKLLRLSGILETLDTRQHQAIDEQWSYLEFLERLLQDEVERRAQKQLDLRVRRAGLNSQKTLDNFDFAFNPAINRQQILQLAAGDYIRRHHNIVLCGPSGVGKSHLASALAHAACQQGFNVLVVNAHKLLQHLNGGRADNTFDRRLATYLRPDLLVIDDFGLKPLAPPAPQDLYDVIAERYEQGSILLTSNRAPTEWLDLFGDPLLGVAGLDRLLHHADVLTISGASFRARSRAAILTGSIPVSAEHTEPVMELVEEL